MSDSILGSVVGIILGMILLFVGPIYDMFNTTDKMVDTIANSAISSFQKDVRKNGYIDMETYHALIRQLNKTGRVYEIDIEHTSKLVYPSTTTPNDYEVHEIKYGTEYIINSIKDDFNEKYCMKYGDDFKVKIKEKEVAPSRTIFSVISNKSTNLLTFTSGGMVENEVYE